MARVRVVLRVMPADGVVVLILVDGQTLDRAFSRALIVVREYLAAGARVDSAEVHHYCRSCGEYHPADPADGPSDHEAPADGAAELAARLN